MGSVEVDGKFMETMKTRYYIPYIKFYITPFSFFVIVIFFQNSTQQKRLKNSTVIFISLPNLFILILLHQNLKRKKKK